MRAMRTRTSRKLWRARTLNQKVSASSSGMMAKVTSASLQLSQNSTPTMPASSTMSPKIDTRPAVKSSLSASTSVVTRVTRRPAGERSKKATDSFCKWPQVGHDALPHELHDVALGVEHDKGEHQRTEVRRRRRDNAVERRRPPSRGL